MKNVRLAVAILAGLTLAPQLVSALQLTEVMYDPEGSDTKREWVEVYNDAGEVIDLTQYTLLENSVRHGIQIYEGSEMLAADQYAIIAKDAEAFEDEYSGIDNLFDSVFTLANTGEEISILDEDDNEVTSVRYRPEWGAEGDGNSLNLVSGTWQPRRPSPGASASTDELESTDDSSSSRRSVLDPIVSNLNSTRSDKIAAVIPEYAAAKQLVNFSISDDDSDYRYYWEFGDGAQDRGSLVTHSYELPGTYGVIVTARDKKGNEVNKVTSHVNVEPVDILISTGYYMEQRYLRLKNNTQSSLNLDNYEVLVGSNQDYRLPDNLKLAVGADYAFNLSGELAYPVIIRDADGNVIEEVSKPEKPSETFVASNTNQADSSTSTSVTSNHTQNSSNDVIVTSKDTTGQTVGSIATATTPKSKLANKAYQTLLRERFDSYDQFSDSDNSVAYTNSSVNGVQNPGTLLANSNNNGLVLGDSSVNQSDELGDSAGGRGLINLLFAGLFGAGAVLFFSTKQFANQSVLDLGSESQSSTGDSNSLSADEFDIIEVPNDEISESVKQLGSSLIFKNISALGVSEVIIRLFKFFIIAYAARVFGPEGFGLFNYALALAALVAVVGDFGINRVITRNLAQERDESQNYGQSFLIQALVLGVFCLGGAFALAVLQDTTLAVLFFILAIYTATNVLGDYVWSFFRARENMVIEASAKSLQAAIILVLGGFVLFVNPTVLGLAMAYMTAAITSLLVGLFYLRKVHGSLFRPRLIVWKNLLRQSWPIALVSVSAFIFNQIDSIMLGLMGMVTEVGLYSSAYKLIGGFLIPAVIINQVLFPRFSQKDWHPGLKLVKRNFVINVFLYGSLSTLLFLFGGDILNLLFGPSYETADGALFILSIAMLATVMVLPLSNWTVAKDYLKINLFLSLVAAGINIGLNFMLIPAFSYTGAATATAVTYLFLLGGYSVSLYDLSDTKPAFDRKITISSEE